MTGDARLDGRSPAINPLHNFNFLLFDDLLTVFFKIPAVGNKEGGVSGISKGRLNNQILTQLFGDLPQMLIIIDFREHIRHTGNARFLCNAVCIYLVIHGGTHFGRRETNFQPSFPGKFFRFFIKHQEHRLACLTISLTGIQVVDHLRVPEQVVVDILNTFKFLVGHFLFG